MGANLSPARRQEIIDALKRGESVRDIRKHRGVCSRTIIRVRKVAGIALQRPQRRSEVRAIEEAALQELVAALPVDTRSLTARLLGDPIFERSALARKPPSP